MSAICPGDFVCYSVGFVHASVCTSLTDEQAIESINAFEPTGVGPWSISPDAFRDGTPNGSPCPDHPTHRHLLFEC